MSLRHAVLAALSRGEASGYELAKRFDVAVADFWSATPQQLYRDLERLERDGLVEARVVEQRRRPTKRVFTLTAAGHQALREFVREPARPAAIRDEFLVKLQAVESGDAGALVAGAEARLARSREKLAGYERLLAESGDDLGPYLTLMAGIMYEQQNIQWTELVLQRLRGGEDGTA
ncbi:PadR family transcriptional regulator [Paractinoplanes atraurantiacus]|uniref:DNA-binding transcriptional regulator, PadR family n=1 Tax=Paractinoplanes atraurantiacus TaxID=1036182 RepID=A0A285H6R4_9ACTN|nr:PadR family transcriptional regulator [Actinoplanes atraurantiacus]SNY31440.1 DNA-binding transcriptional regulator, PadR family [Actinoplanes atraurantiacus]